MANQDYLAMNPGETLILEVRRHWINVLPFFVSTAVVILAGFLLIGYAGSSPDGLAAIVPGLTLTIITPVVALLDILALFILFFAYIVYSQNRLVLTNMHLVQITQNGLFGRTLSKLSLDELQDVRGTRKGVFGTIFNYGEILIESAGNEENFLFRPAPDPLNIAERINDTHEIYEKARHQSSGLSDDDYAARRTAEIAGVAPQPQPQPQPPVQNTGEFPDQAFTPPSNNQQPPTPPAQ